MENTFGHYDWFAGLSVVGADFDSDTYVSDILEENNIDYNDDVATDNNNCLYSKSLDGLEDGYK